MTSPVSTRKREKYQRMIMIMNDNYCYHIKLCVAFTFYNSCEFYDVNFYVIMAV